MPRNSLLILLIIFEKKKQNKLLNNKKNYWFIKNYFIQHKFKTRLKGFVLKESFLRVKFNNKKMGSSHSVEIPGGGTEGYHVLKVNCYLKLNAAGTFSQVNVSFYIIRYKTTLLVKRLAWKLSSISL